MENRKSIVLLCLTALSATSSVAALIIAGKVHQIWPDGLSVVASMWLFPLVFVFGNIVTEIYGKRISRWVTVATFGCTLFAVGYYVFAIWLPYPEFWHHQQAYETVLIKTPRIVVASIVAYLIASNVAVLTMATTKRAMKGRWLWSRICITALVSQLLDSVLFVGIAFIGVYPLEAVVEMVITSAVLKVAIQLIGIPFSYWVVGLVKERIE